MNGLRKGQIKAVLFDKDGTLFDFRKTWEAWAAGVLHDLAKGDAHDLEAMARAIRFDLGSGRFHSDSLVIAGTNAQIAAALASILTEWEVDALETHLVMAAQTAPLAPVTDLPVLLGRLRAGGLKLGVMTNDSFSVAEAHLNAAGIFDQFDLVLGADSGHGAKPSPDPLIAFCRYVGVDPSHTVMVGDSTHDLDAGRAAGTVSVGVLTGIASTGELAPHADKILNDISLLPEWLQLDAP